MSAASAAQGWSSSVPVVRVHRAWVLFAVVFGFAMGAALLGIGTAMVYPSLLAAIGDVALPAWRASSVGVYRFWRDLGYAVGALLAGISADVVGLSGAMWIVAGITALSGLLAAVRMHETLQHSTT